MKIIITGATKGLGRAITEIFAKNGFDVAICSRTQADLDAFQTALKGTYPNIDILTMPVDVSKKEEVLAFAAMIKNKWNKVDVLMNNAGVFLPGAISEEAEGTLERQIETNLYSAYHLTRAILPIMLPEKRGHIFNMCSVASQIAYPNGGSYSISKFALLGFSKVLREEMKDKGIRVTSILPGATWSASWAGVELPEERLMQAADIAKVVWNAYDLADTAVMEEVVIRPQLGDL